MEEWQSYDLNDKILQNLQRLNFLCPTEIQKKVLVYANAKVDLIIQAKTGEGKTLCYGIPIVNYILNFYERAPDKKKNISPVALIIVPTRELAKQVQAHISAILKDFDIEHNLKEKSKNYFNIKIINVIGGLSIESQTEKLDKMPEIIVATPGRLWEIIDSENSQNFINKIYRLKFFVLDEADRLTEKGHFKQLKNIIDYIYTKKQIGKENTEETPNFKSKVNEAISVEDEGEGKDRKDENKKISKALKKKGVNIDYNQIEEIDPMQMFEGTEDIIDNFNFENEEGEELNADEDQDEVTDIYKLKGKKKEKLEVKENDAPVNLRTFLCSATIEQVHKKEEKRFKNKFKKKKPENKTEKENKVNLDNLIKNLKFYNKLIYVKFQAEKENLIEDKFNQNTQKTLLKYHFYQKN